MQLMAPLPSFNKPEKSRRDPMTNPNATVQPDRASIQRNAEPASSSAPAQRNSRAGVFARACFAVNALL